MKALTFLERPQSTEAEAIRALRTRIMAQHYEQGHKILALCAVTPNVGCSFVAANLAIACAQIGIKTMLVDTDIRTPRLGQMFTLPKRHAGLSEYLARPNVLIDEIIQRTKVPWLSVIAAGAVPPNPQELLASARFKTLADALEQSYDLTIFDTTPTNTCTDAQSVATIARYSLIVARKHVSFVEDVRTLSRLLRADRSDVIGTVLNIF